MCIIAIEDDFLPPKKKRKNNNQVELLWQMYFGRKGKTAVPARQWYKMQEKMGGLGGGQL